MGILERLELSEIKELLTYGPSVVAIFSRKDKSSRIYTRRKVESIPSVVRNIVDVTGASDGYVAGFLSGYTKTRDLRIAGMLGAIEASFIVENFGCQTNLPNWKELSSRCKTIFDVTIRIISSVIQSILYCGAQLRTSEIKGPLTIFLPWK